MRISHIKIQNFRAFAHIIVPLDKYVAFVGPNGSGKSTILSALNIFFRQVEGISIDGTALTKKDFHNDDTTKKIIITITFSDLDDTAQDEFSNYFRQDKLIVSAEAKFDKNTGKAEVRQFGQRMGFEKFKPFFRSLNNGAKVNDLKRIYAELKDSYSELPSTTTKDAMADALRLYESERPDECVPIPSEDQFYGFSKGANRLARFVQWVYVPAVKDAVEEGIENKNTTLGKLLARKVRGSANFEEEIGRLREDARSNYQQILEQNQSVLDGLSENLGRRIGKWAHPDATLRLEWSADPDRALKIEEPFAKIVAGESGFEGDIARFGTGLQRSFLLALLQELAETDGSAQPTLILGCEEPELYQHPPQIRHLSSVLTKLSEENSQILVTTHHPAFVSGENFENVRVVRKCADSTASEVQFTTFERIAKKVARATAKMPVRPVGAMAQIHQLLQTSVSDLFFATRVVLVEGWEDAAFLMSYLAFSERLDEFRRIGCHIIPVSGKSQLLRPIIIARELGIPTCAIFDADSDKCTREEHKEEHKRDNKALLNIAGLCDDDPFPTKTVAENGLIIWPNDISATLKAEVGNEAWGIAQSEANTTFGHTGNLKKNTLHIGACLANLWDRGIHPAGLNLACEKILDENFCIG